MRILQLVQKPQRRGAEIFAFSLSSHLLEQGNQVCTAYLYPESGPHQIPLRDGDLVAGTSENDPLEHLVGCNPSISRRLSQTIHDFRPHVVQVNGARTVKYGALLRFLANNKWVLVYRNIGDPKKWVQGWRRKLFYRSLIIPRVSGIVAVSAATLNSLKSVYGYAGPSTIIPRGVDPNTFIPLKTKGFIRDMLQTPTSAPVLVFAGSLTHEKRLDRLLRIMKNVCNELPDTYLWIVGAGPLRTDLETQAEQLGLTSRIRFTGIQDDVASFLGAADLAVLTSDTEGTPGVILEAGLLSIPAVATRVGGVPECVQEGKTGMLLEPDDEKGFSGAILSFLLDIQKRISCGIQAREWVLSSFAMDRITSRYLEFYMYLLGRENIRI